MKTTPTMFLSQQSEKLHQMIKDGQTEKAKEFIKSHPNSRELCDLECSRDGTALHMAAKVGNLEMAKVILGNGVKVTSKVTEGHVIAGFTPLHCSVKVGHLEMTELLIDQGADINATDQDGRTPLILACIYNKPELARVLVDWGADLNIKDSKGQTALLVNILRSDFQITELLVLNGADVKHVDLNGQSALHYASEWGKADVVSLLLTRGADVNLQDGEHQTALHLADDDAIYSLLLEHGADDHIRDKQGKKPREEKLNMEKEEYRSINKALAGHTEKRSKRDPTQHVHDKITRVFSPGPPIPEAELKNAKTNMLKELQRKVPPATSTKASNS